MNLEEVRLLRNWGCLFRVCTARNVVVIDAKLSSIPLSSPKLLSMQCGSFPTIHRVLPKVYIYMPCRGYTLCRSYNFDKILLSKLNFDKLYCRSYNFDNIVCRSCNFGKECNFDKECNFGTTYIYMSASKLIKRPVSDWSWRKWDTRLNASNVGLCKKFYLNLGFLTKSMSYSVSY
jgi:hypothetical protein